MAARGDGNRQLACTFVQTLVNVLYVLGSERFQLAGQVEALKDFAAVLFSFADSGRSRDPRHIVSDPGWKVVMASATTVLALLSDNPCNARPGIGD
jgi:hypothetical protein